MESFVTFGDETIENTTGHMEDIEVKKEVDNITLDIVKHELPLDEIKYKICTDIEDNKGRPDIKHSGHTEDIEVKKEADDIPLDLVKHELPLGETKYEICSHMEDNKRKPDIKFPDMARSCAVPGFGKSYNHKKYNYPDLTLHFIPKTIEAQNKCLDGLEDLRSKSDSALHMYAVCNDHFKLTCFRIKDKTSLNRGVFPSLNRVTVDKVRVVEK